MHTHVRVCTAALKPPRLRVDPTRLRWTRPDPTARHYVPLHLDTGSAAPNAKNHKHAGKKGGKKKGRKERPLAAAAAAVRYTSKQLPVAAAVKLHRHVSSCGDDKSHPSCLMPPLNPGGAATRCSHRGLPPGCFLPPERGIGSSERLP